MTLEKSTSNPIKTTGNNNEKNIGYFLRKLEASCIAKEQSLTSLKEHILDQKSSLEALAKRMEKNKRKYLDLCDILQVAKHHRTQRDQSFDEEMKELEHLQQRLGTFDAKVGNVHQELESREYEMKRLKERLEIYRLVRKNRQKMFSLTSYAAIILLLFTAMALYALLRN